MSRAQHGDSEAFNRLAENHELRLYRQALSLCRDTHTAEDLTAETLIEAWKSLPRFRSACRFSTWLFGILLHRYQKFVRRQQSRPPSLASLASAEATQSDTTLSRIPSPEPGAPEQVVQLETRRLLQAAIDRLPPTHQAVVLLRFHEDARLPEIAAALRIPLGTVKSRLHHALENLRHMPDLLNLLRPPEDP